MEYVRTWMVLSSFFCAWLAAGQDLPTYIALAFENNPELQAFRLRYEQAEERIEEADWLPGTELSAGYFASEPETRTGAQKARFSARQMLPWFGTLSARTSYNRSMAEAEYLDFVVARRKLALEITQSYYNLYKLRARRAVLLENLELLTTYEQWALTSVEVGRASAVDVLRLQIRQNELQEQWEVLGTAYVSEQAQFNALLGRAPESEVSVFENATIPETDPVLRDSIRLNPEILRFEKLYESVAQAELLNQKERAPSLGVGIDYIPVQERPDMDFSDNGKDIVMPMVTLNIPLFDNRYASRSRQNELRQREFDALASQRQNTLQAALARAVSERDAARIRFDTQEENLARAQDAEDILLKTYETGTVDFNDVLDLQELQLKFQLSRIDAVQNYFSQSAIIEYITN